MNPLSIYNCPLSFPTTMVSLAFGAGCALVATGHATDAVRNIAESFFRKKFLQQKSLSECGESQSEIGNGNVAFLKKIGSSWESVVRGADGTIQKVISMGSKIYGSPSLIPQLPGFVLAAAKKVAGDGHRFQVSLQRYDSSGNASSNSVHISNPVAFNPAKIETPIATAPLKGNRVAIAWQETRIGAQTNQIVGVIVDRLGKIFRFNKTDIHACDGPPMIRDFNGDAAVSWADLGSETYPERISHHVQVYSPDKPFSRDSMIVGDHFAGRVPSLEPNVGNENERDLAWVGKDRFVYVWKQKIRGGLSVLAQTISGGIFNVSGAVIRKFSMHLPGKGKKCSLSIRQITPEQIEVSCSNRRFWYEVKAGVTRCIQSITPWFKEQFKIG